MSITMKSKHIFLAVLIILQACQIKAGLEEVEETTTEALTSFVQQNPVTISYNATFTNWYNWLYAMFEGSQAWNIDWSAFIETEAGQGWYTFLMTFFGGPNGSGLTWSFQQLQSEVEAQWYAFFTQQFQGSYPPGWPTSGISAGEAWFQYLSAFFGIESGTGQGWPDFPAGLTNEQWMVWLNGVIQGPNGNGPQFPFPQGTPEDQVHGWYSIYQGQPLPSPTQPPVQPEAPFPPTRPQPNPIYLSYEAPYPTWYNWLYTMFKGSQASNINWSTFLATPAGQNWYTFLMTFLGGPSGSELMWSSQLPQGEVEAQWNTFFSQQFQGSYPPGWPNSGGPAGDAWFQYLSALFGIQSGSGKGWPDFPVGLTNEQWMVWLNGVIQGPNGNGPQLPFPQGTPQDQLTGWFNIYQSQSQVQTVPFPPTQPQVQPSPSQPTPQPKPIDIQYGGTWTSWYNWLYTIFAKSQASNINWQSYMTTAAGQNWYSFLMTLFGGPSGSGLTWYSKLPEHKIEQQWHTFLLQLFQDNNYPVGWPTFASDESSGEQWFDFLVAFFGIQTENGPGWPDFPTGLTNQQWIMWLTSLLQGPQGNGPQWPYAQGTPENQVNGWFSISHGKVPKPVRPSCNHRPGCCGHGHLLFGLSGGHGHCGCNCHILGGGHHGHHHSGNGFGLGLLGLLGKGLAGGHGHGGQIGGHGHGHLGLALGGHGHGQIGLGSAGHGHGHQGLLLASAGHGHGGHGFEGHLHGFGGHGHRFGDHVHGHGFGDHGYGHGGFGCHGHGGCYHH